MNEGSEASDFLKQMEALAAKGQNAYDDVPPPTPEEVAPETLDVTAGVVEPVAEASDLLSQLRKEKLYAEPSEPSHAHVPLLPPDAPSRMTPQPSDDEKPKKKTSSKKQSVEEKMKELEERIAKLEAAHVD